MNAGFTALGLSVVTGPLYTIGMSMQLSVLPHLTIYGDLKPEDIKKPAGLLRGGLTKMGLLSAGATTSKEIIKVDEKLAED
jgi:hypothetical protein